MNTLNTTDLSTLTAMQLYLALRDQYTLDDERNLVMVEYVKRFNAHQVVPSQLEYPMELIYELGFWVGNELPILTECGSSHHGTNHAPCLTLPYAFVDGTKRMVCKECGQLEFNDYNHK